MIYLEFDQFPESLSGVCVMYVRCVDNYYYFDGIRERLPRGLGEWFRDRSYYEWKGFRVY